MPARKPSRPSTKTPPHSTAGAKTSAKATVSGPTRKGSEITDAATAKIAGTEAVAGAMPFNAAKPGEFGDAAMEPPQGQSVEPPHPMVSGSTLTEINASEKVGRGNPQMSFNATNGPLD